MYAQGKPLPELPFRLETAGQKTDEEAPTERKLRHELQALKSELNHTKERLHNQILRLEHENQQLRWQSLGQEQTLRNLVDYVNIAFKECRETNWAHRGEGQGTSSETENIQIGLEPDTDPMGGFF